MTGLAGRALILSLSRFANYGLMLISPMILVRLISVEDFGRYREFVLYASFLQAIAGFGISASLLYFIPSHRESTWRIVRVTALLTFFSSVGIVGVVVLADLVSNGALVGEYLIPITIYVLFFVNLDFWEYLWLGNNRALAVLAYSVGRLTTRLIVVIGIAALTGDVKLMIWSLCVLEGVRIALAAVGWRLLDKSKSEPAVTGVWREQLKFCLPAGFATLIFMANRNLGNFAVTKVLGVTALAHYSIGLYGEPILIALRASISSVLIPEMVSRGGQSAEDSMHLWRRSIIISCILLFPVAILLLRYAEPLIVMAFGEEFRAAAPVLQMYVLVIIRECFDFSPPLRAINKTRPLVYSNAVALVANAAALFVLLPYAGIVGAVAALVISSYVDALYLGWCVSRMYRAPLRTLLPWRIILQVGAASALAILVILSSAWTELLGFAGVVVGSVTYVACFMLLLRWMKVQEAKVLTQRAYESMAMVMRKVRA